MLFPPVVYLSYVYEIYNKYPNRTEIFVWKNYKKIFLRPMYCAFQKTNDASNSAISSGSSNNTVYICTLRLQFTKCSQTRTDGFTKAILSGLRSTLAKRSRLRAQYEILKSGIRKNYFDKAKICEID